MPGMLRADEAQSNGSHGSSPDADVAVLTMVADGPDVLTWFELHTSVAEPVLTSTWAQVEDGRITRVRAAFDPRPLL